MNSADKCQGFPESCKISFRRILSEVRQANRAVRHRELQDRREHGLLRANLRQWACYQKMIAEFSFRAFKERRVIASNHCFLVTIAPSDSRWSKSCIEEQADGAESLMLEGRRDWRNADVKNDRS